MKGNKTMGWKVTITCDEEIWVEELEQIVEDMPKEFRGFIPEKQHMRQQSGFPAYATIGIPEGNSVDITGSYLMTVMEKSARFVVYLMNELSLLNHKNVSCKVDEQSSIWFVNFNTLINTILEENKNGTD